MEKNQLLLKETDNKLSFLSDVQKSILYKYFSPKVYNGKEKIGGVGDKNIQMRIASGYSKVNTVYKVWDKSIGDNFKSVVSHKSNTPDYGILISNYPIDDERNQIGFCGIKVFVSGESRYVDNITSTNNFSMYFQEELVA